MCSLHGAVKTLVIFSVLGAASCTRPPAISKPAIPTPAAVPRWSEYETALANVLLPDPYPSGIPGNGLCEWELWGHVEQEVYVWAECQDKSSDNGTAASVPAVIYLGAKGEIREVVIPRDGANYGADVQKLFPSEVQKRILAGAFDGSAAMKHIATRRIDHTPPLIAQSNVTLP